MTKDRDIAMPDLLTELDNALTSLEKAKAEYALCGGLAVAVHGYARATVDIDIVVLRKDLEQIKAALKEGGFYLDNGIIPLPSQNIEFYRMGKIVGKDVLVVDLLFTDEESYLWQGRERRRWSHGEMWVLSKEALIRMKSTSQREKDQADIVELSRIRSENSSE
ncbi:MAG: nucleotidyltransferase family protein [Candidatus Competibacteraceae bacterium]|nr:nucleotidyltransferase family protein [Candidatus Competibacteraceae bacterium]